MRGLFWSLVFVLLIGNVCADSKRIVNGFDLNKYNSFEDIVKYITSLQNNKLSVESIGFSSEGRPILLLKINRNSTKSILIDGGTHAREWISIASALQLATNFSRTNDWPAVNIYMIPVVNPDGYIYSREIDRMWRNSRSGLFKCGADLNRNFQNNWAKTGTSDEICSEIYHGRKPFSEPESQAVANFMKSHLNELKGYVSLHSYDNAVLIPYGFSNDAYPSDFAQLLDAATKMTHAMNSLYGNNIAVIKSSSLYPASGCSDDFAKSIGIKFTYTIELTTGFYKNNYVGFETPEEMIGKTSDELRVGIVKLLEIIDTQA